MKMKLLLVGIAAVMLICSGGIAQASSVYVGGPNNPEVAIGGIFTIDIFVDTIAPLANLDFWQLGLQLNGPGNVKFAPATNVSTFSNYVFYGNSSDYQAVILTNSTMTVGDLTVSKTGVADVAGKLLARINFDMNSAGLGQMYSLSLFDSGYTYFGDASFNMVGDVSLSYQFHTPQVPIPGAVWLLGSGLVGLIGLRRKLR